MACGTDCACTDCAAPVDAPEVVTAAAGDALPPAEFHCYMTVEGLRTGDHRMFAPGSLTARELPIPLRWRIADEGGHYGAIQVGNIETATLQDDGKWYGTGRFDLGNETAVEAARQCAAGFACRVSADVEEFSYEEVVIGLPSDEAMFDPWAEDLGMETDWYFLTTEGRIAGVTMVDIPAFPQCVIAPLGTPLPDVAPYAEADAPIVVPGLIAAAAPDAPPAEWFGYDEALMASIAFSGVEVTPEGRVYGWVVPDASTCHTGIPGRCQTAPRSMSDYAFAMQGRVKLADGSTRRCGFLTAGTGHAAARLNAAEALAHYDNTGTRVARVAYGETEDGRIWCAGAICPEASDSQVRVLSESPLSGDWRDLGGNLELIASLAVNAPGFPALAASSGRDLGWCPSETDGPRAAFDRGVQVSLVAAGIVRRDRTAPYRAAITELSRRVAVLEANASALAPMARDALRDRTLRTA